MNFTLFKQHNHIFFLIKKTRSLALLQQWMGSFSQQYFSLYIFWSVATDPSTTISDPSFLDAGAPSGTALALTGQEQGSSFGCLCRECGAAHTHPSQTHTVTRDSCPGCPGHMSRTYCNTVCHAGTLSACPRRDLRTHKFSHHLLTSKLWTYSPPACPSAAMRNSPFFPLLFLPTPKMLCIEFSLGEKETQFSWFSS